MVTIAGSSLKSRANVRNDDFRQNRQRHLAQFAGVRRGRVISHGRECCQLVTLGLTRTRPMRGVSGRSATHDVTIAYGEGITKTYWRDSVDGHSAGQAIAAVESIATN